MTPANPEWLLGAQAVSSGVQKCKPLRNCLASNVHLLAIAPYQSVPGLGRVRERECNTYFLGQQLVFGQNISKKDCDLRGFVNDNVCDCPGTCADEEDWDCDTCVCPDVCGIRNRNCFCLVFSIFFLANHQDSVDSVMGQFLPYILYCVYIHIYVYKFIYV